jgi:polyribonucleotide nucleotidyltransferase
VEKVSDYLAEGQIVKVKVMETDEKGRIKLSMKALAERPAGGGDRPAPAERGEREPRHSREGGRQSADQQQQQQQ